MSADDISARLRAVRASPDPQREALREAAGEMRQLIDQLVGSTAPLEVLQAITADLRDVAAVLAAHPNQRAYEFAESSLAGDPAGFFDNSPLAGLANPLAPPINLHVEGDEIVGEVVWNSAYEGPPGCCHGGHIAAAFDEVLGLAQDLAGQSGMTGTLTIRYRKPTLLHTRHRFAGRLDRVEGRKIFTTGELYDPEGTLLAEAEAIFIAINAEHLNAIAAERLRLADGE